MRRRTEAGSRFLALFARAVAHVFYRIDVVGAPPPLGPLILLPNHPNALLDPAIVIATASRPVRFLAKSTLFTGPFGPLMRAAGAIPVYRKQDGGDVRRNTQAFTSVEAALTRGEAVCIFPEGISHSSGMLEPLRTGAARMALSAAAAGLDVRLVPVGINLERKTAFRSRVTIAYGQPLTVTPAPGEDDRQAAQILTVRIADHMRMVMVEAEPTRDALLVERLERLMQSEREPVGQQEALARRRAIADGLQRLRRERPDWYEGALVQLRRYDDRLQRFGLGDAALDWDVSRATAWRFVVREVPAALVLLPVALLAATVFAVPYALTAGAARYSKDMDVTATAKVFGGAVLYGGWMALLAGMAVWLAGPPAAAATVLLLPILAIAGLFAIERESAVWQTARAWTSARSAHPATRQALKRRRAELATVLEEAHEWMGRAGRSGP